MTNVKKVDQEHKEHIRAVALHHPWEEGAVEQMLLVAHETIKRTHEIGIDWIAGNISGLAGLYLYAPHCFNEMPLFFSYDTAGEPLLVAKV